MMRRLLLVLLLALVFLGAAQPPEKVSINIIATTDLHGYLMPFDYYANRPAARGLAKAATIIRRMRKEDSESLLVDCGDVIQGSPLVDLYAKTPHPPDSVHPMTAAMNELEYDDMVVGNHEFNFGLETMLRARNAAQFPWIAANIIPAANADEAIAVRNKDYVGAAKSVEERVFTPLNMEESHGVSIAIIGLTTAAIPNFERPENIEAYHFESALDVAKEWVKYAHDVRHADVVIIAAHTGLEGGLAGENQINEIAQKVPGIDGIIFGHTHQELAGNSVNGVILLQPKFWGQSVGRMTITLERVTPDAKWKVVAKRSEVAAVTNFTEADPAILKIAEPYHQAAQKYLDTPVASTKLAMETRLGRVIDTAALEAIQEVQMNAPPADSKPDVSLASTFDTTVRIAQGGVTVRQLAALYPYENQLVVVDATGEILKEALEHAAAYFGNPQIFGSDFDAAAGVTYKIDISKPVGQRIVDLKWKGAPLDPAQKLRIAINSYRKAGGGGYSMFPYTKIVWQSNVDIRQLMIDYYTARKTIDARAANNWEVIPDDARKTLLANQP